MKKTGFDLLGAEEAELAVRIVFMVIIYSIIGYRIETLSKQSFAGRERSEKAFQRWMKIFETFPEGIALIRNNFILTSNRALSFILDVGIDRTIDEDPYYNLLKADLRHTYVKQWVKNPKLRKAQGSKTMSIWQFLTNNERGAIFELIPNHQEEGNVPKYITLNQVNVRIAGGKDKLLIIRDVTSIVMNDELMESKRHMTNMTEKLMKQMEEMATATKSKLEKMDPYVQA